MWIPGKWQALPTNEWLLTLADHAQNRSGNRGFGTFAVGAVGDSPLKVRLVIGVNSSTFDETKLTSDQNVPPAVRNAIEFSSVVMTKEPYHAEVSCVLWAKEQSMKLLAVASSRQVCQTCYELLLRHAPNAQVVDMWEDAEGRSLTQEQRKAVNPGSGWTSAMGSSGYRAKYSRIINR